jgi:hypothetical protein
MQQWQCGWAAYPKLIQLEPPRYAIVDDDLYDELVHFEWYLIRGSWASNDRNGFTYPYTVVSFEQDSRRVSRVVTMHRMVMSHYGGTLTGGPRVFHRNADKLDNRRENLTFKRSEVVCGLERRKGRGGRKNTVESKLMTAG